jgi:hypothetical protein
MKQLREKMTARKPTLLITATLNWHWAFALSLAAQT